METREEIVNQTRTALQQVKGMKFYYYNVGGMSVDNMINVAKRFYYSKVGRGNQMILSLIISNQLLKSLTLKQNGKWLEKMVDKFKRSKRKLFVMENQ